MTFLEDPTGKDLISDLQRFQETFIDLEGSSFIFTSEEQRFDEALR